MLAVYMFAGSLIPLNDFSQMTKVRNLFEHFQCHSEDYDITFLEFMWEHFITQNEHTHNDETSHDQLPLQSLNFTINGILKSHTFVLAAQMWPHQSQPDTYMDILPQTLVAGILRPPRV